MSMHRTIAFAFVLGVLAVLAACAGHPGKNEAVGSHGRTTDWKANVTKATFDGKLVTLELGPHLHIAIASCYAHTQQRPGDHDHVAIELDHQPATAGELAIADCTSNHMVASLWADFADGTKVEASIDVDLVRTP
jgi:hypothetical protein